MKSKFEIKVHKIRLKAEELLDDYLLEPISNAQRHIREFIRGTYNFWKFRKEVYYFRWWDYSSLYEIMIKSLHEMEEGHKKGSHTVKNCQQAIIKKIRLCRLSLKRLSDNCYDEKILDELYGDLTLNFEPCAFDEYGEPTLFKMVGMPEDSPKRDKLRDKHLKMEKYLKAQDFELFCKMFKTSERWWD